MTNTNLEQKGNRGTSNCRGKDRLGKNYLNIQFYNSINLPCTNTIFGY